MPDFTDHLGLAIFLAGEEIDVDEESIRMHTIDSQLLGLYEIFGNGVLTGWNVTKGPGLNISVSAGEGHINFMSAVSEDATTVADLPANTTSFIFATVAEDTPENRTVVFFSDTDDTASDLQILLASVVTNSTTVTSIDESVRTDISFLALIRDEINKHVHRGGSTNPSKIDLASEVRGRLGASNIADLAADIITSGRLALSRLPQIDHNDLENNGVLTHAQIDSYIKNLQNRNSFLFGELAVNNFLQTVLAMKHIWNVVDELMVNEIAIIPGISPDSFLDESNSTAIIDKIEHTISGVAAKAKSINFARFDSASDFAAATTQNLTVTNGTAQLSLLSETIFVEDFEAVTTAGTDMPNWAKSVSALNGGSSVKSTDIDVTEGVFGGEFTSDEDVRLNYALDLVTKFGSAQDWTSFNKITLDIKTAALEHGQLNLSFTVVDSTTGDDKEIGFFTLLGANAITSGFESKELDISSLDVAAVKTVNIYTDSTIGWDASKDFTFSVDNMKVENDLFVKDSGFIRFRFETPQASTWSSVAFGATIPTGTAAKTRVRTGSSFIDVDNASFGAFFGDGETLDASDSTHIEIEVALSSDVGKTETPVLDSATLTYLTSATSTSFTITSSDDWDNGEKLFNIDASIIPDEINISSPIRAKEIFFGNINLLGQTDRDDVPSIGFDGATLPLSPKQAIAVTPTASVTGFNYIADIKRLESRNYLLTDTFNDRILEITPDGEFVKGYVTDAVNITTEFFPLTAAIRTDLSLLTISFTTATDLTAVDLSKFKINSRGGTVLLSSADKVVNILGNEISGAVPITSKVLRIQLTDENQSQLEELADFDLFIRIEIGGVGAAFSDSTTSSSLENSLFGLSIFRGDMIYIDGIFNPIAIEQLENGNLLIANAKSLSATRAPDFAVNSVIEIDTNGVSQGGNNALNFSVFSLGGIKERNEETFIIAGYDDPTDTVSTKGFVSGDAPDPFLPSTEEVKPTTSPTTSGSTIVSSTGFTELDALLAKRGRVVIIDRQTLKILFSYESPEGLFPSDVQIDAAGLFVIAEKSFRTKNAGRIIKIDENGNVVFQFGFGKMTRPNDVRVLSNGKLLVSV